MLFIWLYKGNIKISNGTIITNNTHTNKKFLNLKLYAANPYPTHALTNNVNATCRIVNIILLKNHVK